MPSNPVTVFRASIVQYRGFFVAALLVVGAITMVAVIGIIVLTAFHAEAPADLAVIAGTGMGFLTGAVVTDKGKKSSAPTAPGD